MKPRECILSHMRTLVLTTVLGLLALTSSCQNTFADGSASWNSQQQPPTARSAQYRNPQARPLVAHTQAPIPTAATAATPGLQSGLIPTRPLSTPSTPAPKPDCAAVCVIDPRTGRTLFTYNAHTRRQVASTQKIVTALCVTDAGNLNKMVTVDAQDGKVQPIKLNLKPGTRYRRGDLLKAMLTGSYNDVAVTLARDTAGSVPAFVRRMNDRARRMRMYNTHFANPNGLPAAQYSTAYDMALAACYAYNNPTIRSYVNIPEFKFRLADGSMRDIKSTNKLLKQYSWVQGMKTGYTNAAGKCLISCGSMNGQSAIVVVLGSTNTKVWNESLKYLRWAFQI